MAAIRDFEKALAITSQLLNNDPDNESLAYEDALLYERIGGLQGMYGRRPEGFQNLNIALNTLRSLGARTGNASRSFQRSAAGIASVIGEVQVMDGRFQVALATSQLQLATYQNFAGRDPHDLQGREDLSGAYYDVGNVLVKMRRFKDGLTMVRRALALDKELISTDPKRTILRSNLAQHRVAQAEALNKVGDPTGALESYKEARGFYQGLADLDDQNLDAHRNASAKIAATYVRLGLLEEALEAYRRALRVSEPPAERNPPNLQAQYTLADTYSAPGLSACDRFPRQTESQQPSVLRLDCRYVIQFFRPRATGRIEFSARLVLRER